MKSQLQIKNLPQLRKRLHNKTIVLTGGGFDVLHPGHIEQLAWAKRQGDILVVHITGDKRFFEKRNRKPLFSQHDRACIITALKPVDYVFVYDGRHYDQNIIDALKPNVLVFNQESFSAEIKRRLETFKGRILVSRLGKRFSSTQLRKNT